MKFKPAIILLICLAACSASPVETPVRATTAPPPIETFTPIPTFTSAPHPTAKPPFQLGNDGKTVVFDFVQRLCEADWMNGAQRNLPCPANFTWSLNSLAGRTVEFVLAVRPLYPSDPATAWTLWISPRIL